MKEFDSFIREKQARGCSKECIDNYTISYNKLIKDTGLSASKDITRELINDWIVSMQDSDLSDSSVNHYITEIRVFAYWLMENEYIKPFKIHKVRVQEVKPKLYSDEEIEKMLTKPKDGCSFSEYRTWAVINFILGTGARAGSVVSVTWDNVNFEAKEIEFPHTKNKKILRIPLSNQLEKVLVEYKKKWKTTNYVFPDVGDKQLTVRALRQGLKRYCVKKDINRFSIHALRHQYAKYWINNGGSIYKLKEILGHSSIEMTQNYIKLFAEDLKEDINSYSPLDKLTAKKSRTQKVRRNEND